MMPSKKKKYNARFPAGRIKKIMQTDEDVGKVAQAVPVIISRTLELFVQSLLTKSIQITQARNAKTLTPSHMKQCILSESRFDFLKDLVKNIPDASAQEDIDNNACDISDVANYQSPERSEPRSPPIRIDPPKPVITPTQPEIVANFYTEQASTSARTPVIQYSPKITAEPTVPVASSPAKLNIDFSMGPPKNMSNSSSSSNKPSSTVTSQSTSTPSSDNVPPPLVPITNNYYPPNSSSDNLLIDEDYDN